MINKFQLLCGKLQWHLPVQIKKFVRILPMNLRKFVFSQAHHTFAEVAVSVKTYQEDTVSHIFKYVSFEDVESTLSYKTNKSLECPSLRSLIEMEVSSCITPTDSSLSSSDSHTETTIVIRMGISGTEVPALDTIIMGKISQIVDLVNNGKVKAATRTVTMVTTTIMAQEAMVRINITSVVEKDAIGVIVNMTTILNKMVTMDTKHNHIVAMVKTNAKTSTLILLLCQTFLALSTRMV